MRMIGMGNGKSNVVEIIMGNWLDLTLVHRGNEIENGWLILNTLDFEFFGNENKNGLLEC